MTLFTRARSAHALWQNTRTGANRSDAVASSSSTVDPPAGCVPMMTQTVWPGGRGEQKSDDNASPPLRAFRVFRTVPPVPSIRISLSSSSSLAHTRALECVLCHTWGRRGGIVRNVSTQMYRFNWPVFTGVLSMHPPAESAAQWGVRDLRLTLYERQLSARIVRGYMA